MLYEPRQTFAIPLDSPELFTAHPFWQRFIETDELTLRECTAAFYLASRRMDRIVGRMSQLQPVPLHLFLAGDERIIDNEKTAAFVHGLGWPGARISQYPQARHSLEFDAASTGYYRDLVAFIDAAD
jgi:alpha-beta hydrolase superfamily lysophospholipase